MEIKSVKYGGRWAMQADEMLATLGVRGSRLPAEGLPPRLIQGVEVWVAPAQPPRNGRKSSKHRVRCKCPTCGVETSPGRLHQHKCKE